MKDPDTLIYTAVKVIAATSATGVLATLILLFAI